jgi:hypothetical protein
MLVVVCRQFFWSSTLPEVDPSLKIESLDSLGFRQMLVAFPQHWARKSMPLCMLFRKRPLTTVAGLA